MGDIQPDPAYDALMVALGKKQPLTLTLTKDIWCHAACGREKIVQRLAKMLLGIPQTQPPDGTTDKVRENTTSS